MWRSEDLAQGLGVTWTTRSSAKNFQPYWIRMRLELIFPGKTKEKYLAEGIKDFLGRLQRYAKVEIRTVKEGNPRKDKDLLLKEEGEYMLKAVRDNSLLVVLDPTGRQLSSEDLAVQLEQWQQQSRQWVTFLVGGPLGLSPEVSKRANLTLSLSKMTFTHDMARMLLIEQLYRAFSILSGSKYHK